MTNMLFWHLTDRFFADMAASIYMEGATRERFLKRDWSMVTNPAGGSGGAGRRRTRKRRDDVTDHASNR